MSSRSVRYEQRLGRILLPITRWLAFAGGIMLSAIAVLTVISIVGRSFVFAGLGPVPGDFELVAAGCAVAVFCFLPWCQINGGHVAVDIFTQRAPAVVRELLALLGNVAMTVIAGVIAWQMVIGLGEKYTYGETTFILGMPVWYGYALGIIGAVLFAVVGAFTVWRSFNDMAYAKATVP